MKECGLGFMRRPNWPENTTHSGADPVRKPRPPIGPMPLNAAGDGKLEGRGQWDRERIQTCGAFVGTASGSAREFSPEYNTEKNEESE